MSSFGSARVAFGYSFFSSFFAAANAAPALNASATTMHTIIRGRLRILRFPGLDGDSIVAVVATTA
jgi:hypothetical protein